jgi:molybdate transport system substrate-binding protein
MVLGDVPDKEDGAMLRRISLVCLALVVIAGIARPASAQSGKILVFAAASLKNAVDAINGKWHAETGKPAAAVSYAASPTLAKQIEEGAPADIFISADLKWMDYLQKRGLIQPKTRANLLGNRLVLIAPVNSPLGTAVHVTLAVGVPLARLLHGGRLAMADPRAVPAGIYGKEALTALGLWSSVAGRIAAAQDVRGALALVARGEAPLGIVYQTDAAIEPAVKIVATFPSGTTPPIVYPMALTKRAGPGTARFEQYLRGSAAAAIFEAQGFAVLGRAR